MDQRRGTWTVLAGALPPAAALAVAAVAGTGLARDAPAPVDAAVLVTATRENVTERRAAAVAVRVYSAVEIERFADATVGDALKRLAGVSFTGPPGVTKDIRLRGLDKGYTTFLINGEPAPATNADRQMQVDRLPADMIERIEIINAPTADMPGQGVGGVINIVLKQGAADETRLRFGAGRNGDLEVGDAVFQMRRSWGAADLILPLSWTVGAEDVFEDKATEAPTGAITQRELKDRPVEKTELLVAPVLTWRLPGAARLRLSPFASLGDEAKDERSRVVNAAGALARTILTDEDKSDHILRFAARLELPAGGGQLRIDASAQSGSGDKTKLATEANAAGAVTKRSREIEDLSETQGVASVAWRGGLGRHGLAVGAEVRAGDFEKLKTVAEGAGATGPLTLKAPGASDIYTARETRFAVYVQDEWAITDAHTLTAGLRAQSYALDARDRFGDARQGESSALLPSLHHRWTISPAWIARASINRSQKLPKFDDLNPLVTAATGANPGSAFNPDSAGNAGLRPETAWGYEIGIDRFLAGDKGYLGVRLYDRRVEDYVERQVRQEGARFVRRPQNAGEARFQGIEIEWNLPVPPIAGHRFAVTGSHSEMRGEITSAVTGRTGDVKDMPPRVTNLGVDWRSPGRTLGAGIAVNHVPRARTVSVSTDAVGEDKARGALTGLDAYASWTLPRSVQLRLIGRNLLAVDKRELTRRTSAAGAPLGAEDRLETSKPTLMLTLDFAF